ncbi:TetR/AcrR family transcriptional regulator [Nocardia wallacei]|uniref:TetR/AcrR family transcriptional regulator n=1 Tax=Nocardia wallacei TaxID=480035 RepID=UPI002455BC37|nr:TetR/AcrR family transcriptional regulator [Nocardia wallacei]
MSERGTSERRTARSGAARRGRPARLSRERIVETALEIVAREGDRALTMRRVADALGAAPMSLYRHVGSKDELLILLLDRVVGELPRPALPDDPRERLVVLLTWQHDQLAARPWIVDVLARGDLMAPSVVWLLEAIYDAWRASGLTLDQAATANRIVWGFTLGALRQRAAPAHPSGREPYQVSVPAGVDPVDHPTLAALRGYWTAPDRRDRFAEDLALLVHALTGAA